MKILITICARGGSKGIPGKNIKPVNGVPLIGLSIKMAQKFAKDKDAHIALSTDDELIKLKAADFGLNTEYQRPENLAGDHAGKIDTIADLLNFEEKRLNTQFDLILDLDVTSPLRTAEDLHSALELLMAKPEAFNIFSVSPANRSPYFNMVEQKGNGFFNLVCQLEDPLFTRQSSPKVYDMNASFYIYRRTFFDQGLNSAITEKSIVYVMDHLCFDLDEPIDYEFLSFLMRENKLEFELGI
ncbi:MAG: acylneuraminate cytidylyltransferase family protein [Bacteroidota bacterium]